MQASCGRGGRAGHAGVNRLVALGVVEALFDVRRQGRLADLRQQRFQPARRREAQDPATAGRLLDDVRPQREPELEPRPRIGGLTRAHQALPTVCILANGIQEQDLGTAPPEPETNPRRQHPGFVDHQKVAGAELVREVREREVPRRAAGGQMEQPRRVALLQGMLSDQPRRQLEFVVGQQPAVGLRRSAHRFQGRAR